MSARAWHLVADIGGTNARFGAADAARATLVHRRDVRATQYADLHAALASFCEEVAALGIGGLRPADACIAIASPRPDAERVTMTNASWYLERERCREILGLERPALINDFEALGYALAGPDATARRQILAGVAGVDGPRLVLGAGTGLGMACIVPGDGGDRVVATEGGHVDLPVETEMEWSLLRFLAQRYGHVSAERVLSGPGLRRLYEFFAGREKGSTPDAPDIVQAARAGKDAAARSAVGQFCATLGAVTGNAALTQGARGGVVLVGTILRELRPALEDGAFAARFLDKGRYRAYLQDVPVHLVEEDDLGLRGALRFLQLRGAATPS